MNDSVPSYREEPGGTVAAQNSSAGCTIDGLSYVPAYLSKDEAQNLLASVDAAPWQDDLQRRVQHYGWRYDYKRRAIDRSLFIGTLPDWAIRLAERLHRDGWSEATPDQLIVNEYEPGQGIASHVDCVPCFGPTVLSISLGASCTMEFRDPASGTKVPVLVEPNSLIVLQRDARYRWQHGIPARKSDTADGTVVKRGRRVSLTFRTVILAAGPTAD